MQLKFSAYDHSEWETVFEYLHKSDGNNGSKFIEIKKIRPSYLHILHHQQKELELSQ